MQAFHSESLMSRKKGSLLRSYCWLIQFVGSGWTKLARRCAADGFLRTTELLAIRFRSAAEEHINYLKDSDMHENAYET